MSELVTKSVAQEPQEQKIETRTAVERIAGFTIVATTVAVLKVIVANPTMIKAYKAGVPGNGQPFPDGFRMVKLQWKPKNSTEAPFVVDVPDVFTQAFVIEKDGKRFPKSDGWGIRGVQQRTCIAPVHGRSQKPLSLWARVPYGGEGEGLQFPLVPEALNRACPDSKKDVPVRGLIFDVDTGLRREGQPIAQQAAA